MSSDHGDSAIPSSNIPEPSNTKPSVNVVLAGVSGIPGRQILAALLAARAAGDDIHLTILKRDDPSTIDDTVDERELGYHIAHVDYTNPSTLIFALSDLQPDVVISALHAEPSPALDEILLHALIEAHDLHSIDTPVPLFISGYTLDVLHPAAVDIATPDIIGPKIKFAHLLEEEAHAGRVKYCTLVTAGFMDYILPRGYTGVDLVKHHAKLYDQGTHECTSSSLYFVAACVLEIVRAVFLQGSPDAGAEYINKRIHVAEVKYTGKQLVASAEKTTGATFEIEQISTDERLEQAKELAAKGEHGPAVSGFFAKLIWGGTGAACFEDGLLFGEGKIPRKKLDDIMAEAVEEAKSGSQFQGVGR